jgi:serine/threonine protein kinase/formylglycine-generating enzyme required for sulfatase activity
MATDTRDTQLPEESWDTRLDRLCDEFEDAWRAGLKPTIEEYIHPFGEPERSDLFRHLLTRELELRLEVGDKPVVKEYDRFQNDQALVQAAFWDAGLPARWIDRFEVIHKLGGGGFGHVYLCNDDRLGRRVAVKVPRLDRLSSAAARAAFLSEARNVAALFHDAIVPLHDFGERDGLCYLVYEYIEGCSLARRLEQGSIPQGRAALLVGRIADALAHAHSEDKYHRDIKPANILLNQRGQPYLTDFGLAIRVQDLAGERGRRVGTVGYMPPEMVRGEGNLIDGRADIYSLGVVLYELLTGKRPFGGTREEVLEKIQFARPRPPREMNAAICEHLQDICLKAMSKEVSDRYVTADKMAESLRKAAAAFPEGETIDELIAPDKVSSRYRSSSTVLPATRVEAKGLRPYGDEDKTFFLELLPGPRDHNWLPESIRFWKTRIESTDPDLAFAVGLIYGPSGCGKSSFVKAGLIPQLKRSAVIPLHVEAVRENTEDRIMMQLRNRALGVGPRASLRTTLGRLRRNRGLPPGSKILIVLDQFEQWLHAHAPDMEDTELVAALRQADGEHVQVILMVRSDFWVSTTLLFQALKINLNRDNQRVVELFSESHARHVLHLFGVYYGKLPEGGAEFTRDQADFIDLAVKELKGNGGVIPVRLSLFAEMMKDRAWTPSEFKKVDIGLEYVGQVFAEPAVNANKGAAEKLLDALLPAADTDIKGQMRSRSSLAQEAGLMEDSHEFTDLLDTLNRKYVLTGTDPPTNDSSSEDRIEHKATVPPARYYQLTHDFLVPALREHFAQEQGKTFRGRAKRRLRERAAQWHAEKKNRFLPAWWEWANILIYTRRNDWTGPQRRMMRRATRYHFVRTCALAIVLVAAGLAAFELNGRFQAQARMTHLIAAEPREVLLKIKDLEPYRRWANEDLFQLAQDASADAKKRRNANLALLPAGQADVDFLVERLLTGEPDEVRVIGRALRDYRPEMAGTFWSILENRGANGDRRLRAACALAVFEPESQRWQQVSNEIVAKLVTEPLTRIPGWKENMEPKGDSLVQPLAGIVIDAKRSETERSVAADLLASYAANSPETLAELVKSAADPRSAATLLPALLKDQQKATASMDAELTHAFAPNLKVLVAGSVWDLQVVPEAEKEKLAKRRARSAVTLLRLGRPEAFWSLLGFNPDPRVRTYLIHSLAPLGVEPQMLVSRLNDKGADAWVRRAILLSLGEFPADRVLGADSGLIDNLVQMYRTDPDGGIHSAVEWLMRRWGRESDLKAMPKELISQEPLGNRQWYVNREEHTLVTIPGPVQFWMGSPGGEQYRIPAEEAQRRVFIPYSFAIATKEVTNGQYARFLQENPHIRNNFAGSADTDPNEPVANVSWFEAAQYCRWQSEKEHLNECYPPIKDIKEGMQFSWATLAQPGGYRLPTVEEWEYTCRAGSITSRAYGDSEEMLEHYAWYALNSKLRARPVGLLKPNDFGIFDMHGNVGEWCQDQPSTVTLGKMLPETAGRITIGSSGSWRGGAFLSLSSRVRSATVMDARSKDWVPTLGFRIARTLPNPK